MFKFSLGSFGAFPKIAGLRAKLSEIWDSCSLATHIWGSFDRVWFNVILGSFSALVSDMINRISNFQFSVSGSSGDIPWPSSVVGSGSHHISVG